LPRFLEHIDDLDRRVNLVEAAIHFGVFVSSYFPAPGEGARLHDTEERRRAISISINEGGFTPEQQAELRESLELNLLNLVEMSEDLDGR
jgi:hypothetical protein